jgi:sugar phosphate permease
MATQRGSQRWVVLFVALIGLVAGCASQYGLSYLIPALRGEGLSLESATTLVIAPVFGILVALIAWGAAADRWGERLVLTVGLAGAGVALLVAAGVGHTGLRWVLLLLSGASGASIHSASGRLILGSFDASERGLAMGIRQTGQPLGLAVAALVLPALATGGIGLALGALGAACLGSAAVIGLVVRDPETNRQARTAGPTPSPYRSGYLWRIHASSALLVIPQFAVAVFAFDYLVTGLGWSSVAAGLLLAATQLVGAGGRLAAGFWSDRVHSRLRPMRQVAIVITLSVAALAGLGLLRSPISVVALSIAAVVTLAPNGLAFTAVAERAGSAWAGRALGVQNTGQNLVGAVAAAPLAVVVSTLGGGIFGYGAAFAVATVFPLLAAFAIPYRQERRNSISTGSSATGQNSPTAVGPDGTP